MSPTHSLSVLHSIDDDFSPTRITSEENVDYLSYNFDEMDLALSWRMSTKQKMTVANGIRLENASWRSWNKQRNHLKTVDPQSVNWLKECDVTWLYGPLHTVIKDFHHDQNSTKKQSQTVEQTSQSPKPLKSALKKVSQSDLMKKTALELQVMNSTTIEKANRQLGEFSPEVIANHRQPKLRFNPYVEQCVAVSDEEQIRIYNRKKRNSGVVLSKQKDSRSEDEEYEASAESSSEDEDDTQKSPHSSIRKIEPSLLKPTTTSDGIEDTYYPVVHHDGPDEHLQYTNNVHDSMSRHQGGHALPNYTHDSGMENKSMKSEHPPLHRTESAEIAPHHLPEAGHSLDTPAKDKPVVVRPKIIRSHTDINTAGIANKQQEYDPTFYDLNKHHKEKKENKSRDSFINHVAHLLGTLIWHKKK
ncbi:hypothetical protein BDB01DRAFT_901848 [Pilobolus umbonatus]|nr:hypothetical protein BDB01DRAFT_901848 [Pilobolus umbonatus]